MKPKDINTIISKYLDDEATVSEEIFLLEWIQIKANRAYFEDFVRTQTWVAHNYDTSLIEKQLNALSIHTPVKKNTFGVRLVKYAAVLIAVCAASFFAYTKIGQSGYQDFRKDLVTLEVNDGSSTYHSLENRAEFSPENETILLKEGNELHYKSVLEYSDEIHTIHVPYGKTFTVVLSDGSVVQLNSGSRFSYPPNFRGQAFRSVSLVGEGYFTIAKSSVPFRVKTENLTTEVLGTVFNISAYEDDAENEVILVEGSVQLVQDNSSALNPSILMPNQKANTMTPDGSLQVRSIDINDYLGWTEGVLVFYKDDMATILKKLERRFNIKIENTYEKLESLHFSGKFSKSETLEEVLKTMQAHTDFLFAKTAADTLMIYEPDNTKSL